MILIVQSLTLATFPPLLRKVSSHHAMMVVVYDVRTVMVVTVMPCGTGRLEVSRVYWGGMSDGGE